MDEKECCGNCRFWKPNSVNTDFDKTDGGYGFCRRYPPAVDHAYGVIGALIKIATTARDTEHERDKLSDDMWNDTTEPATLADFPVTEEIEWCGEWEKQ